MRSPKRGRSEEPGRPEGGLLTREPERTAPAPLPAPAAEAKPGVEWPCVPEPAATDGRTGPLGPAPPRWVLESRAETGTQLRRVPIHPLPFRIGRRPGLDLTLPSLAVSKTHAEIYEVGDLLRLRDLGSTNGTFLNHELITDGAVSEGDILHFADFEFRLGRQEPGGKAAPIRSDTTITMHRGDLSRQFAAGTRELTELIRESAVTVAFQAIVEIPSGAVAAYEALGRGRHPRLPESPSELFRIAESLGAEGELSRLFRRRAVELVGHRPRLPTLFLNTHPSELRQPGLVESLEELRSLAPHLDLALEIHESALAAPAVIGALRERLAEMNVGLAYDDFGAGQARLLELAEAPPHYLKFDRRFVTGIDQAPLSRRRLLTSLVTVARELLVKTVAEGIETAAEYEVCASVGFTHGQGYYLSRPVPVEDL
jgi:EAL domain-containing protein (putative c-di-GMP-specific phosphodiesterase class I)